MLKVGKQKTKITSQQCVVYLTDYVRCCQTQSTEFLNRQVPARYLRDVKSEFLIVH